jgi:hypothetical protein
MPYLKCHALLAYRLVWKELSGYTIGQFNFHAQTHAHSERAVFLN